MEATTTLPESFSYGQLFSWLDYTLFGAMLAISTIIGIYFGFFGKKQNTANDYLMGGKEMSSLPIAVSLVASQISTTTLIAVPADVYKFGANYIWLSVATIIVGIVIYFIYLPVFFKLQLTSVFEYLELRFDRKLRILASLLTLFGVLVFCPVVIYVPSLAFSQVTGINVKLIGVLTSLICVFYTTVGGLKAVVWTDTFQFVIMIVTFVVVFFMGTSSIGGFTVVMDRSIAGGRFEVLDFRFDPTMRDSFAALILGGTAQWIAFTGVYQGFIQKCLSLPTFKDVKRALSMYTISMALTHAFVVFMGMLMYAKYWNCDPLTSNQIYRAEQMVPQFVMEVAGNLPGLPGIFIAGVFSAGLSSLSACLNSTSAIIYQDFISPFMPSTTSQRRISNILKLIVAVLGVAATLFLFILDKVNGIFQFYVGVMAVACGPLLGIFTMGLLFPFVNSKGAFYGGILSMAAIGWISFQNQWYQSQGLNNEFLKPMSTEGCNHTITVNMSNVQQIERPFYLYRVSFWFYSLMGAICSMICGSVISWFTRKNDAHVAEELLSPIVYNLLGRTSSQKNDKLVSGNELENIPLKG